MRYATKSMGETTNLLGKFTAGRLTTQIQLVLINIETNAIQPISTPNCIELTGSVTGGRSTYKWSSANIVTQPITNAEFHYIMTDTVTGQVQDGKFTVGGYPDQSAAARYQSAVHIDTTGTGFSLPVSGVFQFPYGTPGKPINNLVDAVTIATFLGLREYHINGTLTLATNHSNWTFTGEEPRQDILIVSAGVSVADSNFTRLGIRGDLTGTISTSECLVGESGSTTTGLDGVFIDTGFSGGIVLADGATFRGLRVNWLDLISTIIDFDTPSLTTQFMCLCAGNFTMRNANIQTLIGLSLQGGRVTYEATMTGAISWLYGSGERSNVGNPVLSIDNDFLVRGSRIDDRISSAGWYTWEEPVAGHVTSGSMGAAQGLMLAGSVSQAKIDITTTPWREIHYTFAAGGPPDTVVSATYELYDQIGVAIAGTHLAGNNPLADPTRLLAERRRI